MDTNKPWSLKQPGDAPRRSAVLYTAMEALRVTATLLLPIIPVRG